MSIGTRWILVAATMAASLLAVSSASAALTAEIRDEAGFFSPEAIQKACGVRFQSRSQTGRERSRAQY